MKTVTRHPSVGRTPWSARDPLVALRFRVG